ncbi:hypothetical protein [Pseudomonas fluorescens]|uniref:hypothetical protein n=1 Tax=Pseudomonas fluorescens TaxID=294 RepID=UPI001CD48A59|nr:hypothetical protein [Pseudomonas fluorescens]
MAWIFEKLPSLLDTHRFRIIEMYLTIARYSDQPMWNVLGTASSPGCLDQFTRGADGRWLEYHPKKRVPVPLSTEFDTVFDRYLLYLNIEPDQPPPASALFPKEDSIGAYDSKGLLRILTSVRQTLADAAKASNNPAISEASEKILGLTMALIRNRAPADD